MNQPKRIDEGNRASIMLKEISGLVDGHIRFMEVCGTHTVSIFRSGIRSLLPEGIELISGPGCPVCVTPVGEIDRAIALAQLKDVTLLTFGDLMRVPGTRSSFNQERAMGRDIRVITFPLDALEIAQGEPQRRTVFFAVGFETTSPAIAAAVKEARRRGIANLYLLSSHCAALNGLVQAMLEACSDIRLLRDPTRGGLATVLWEIANASKVGIVTEEEKVNVRKEVIGVCDLLGFDPFYLANEGKLIAFVPQEETERVLDAMKADPLGRESVIIGRVVDENPGKALLKTRIGGHRLLEPLSGEQFPRIC